jgi:hypothetical protein
MRVTTEFCAQGDRHFGLLVKSGNGGSHHSQPVAACVNIRDCRLAEKNV